MKKKRNAAKKEPWVVAQKKYKLTTTQIAMAKELGLNPKKFGSYANHKQQPWKSPLPDFIEELYEKRFKKAVPPKVQATDKKKKKINPIKNQKIESTNFEDFMEDDLPF